MRLGNRTVGMSYGHSRRTTRPGATVYGGADRATIIAADNLLRSDYYVRTTASRRKNNNNKTQVNRVTVKMKIRIFSMILFFFINERQV